MSERSKEWERIVKKQAESGLTAAEYCRSHGLDVQQFYYRSRVHRKRTPRADVFVPARVVNDGVAGIEIELYEARIRFSGPVRGEVLAETIRAVKEALC